MYMGKVLRSAGKEIFFFCLLFYLLAFEDKS